MSVTAHADKAAKPSPVTLAQVTRTEMRQEAMLYGTSVPWRQVKLSPLVAGLATEVHVDAGDWVSAGDPVLALDARLAEIEIQAAEARVTGAEAKRRDTLRIRNELLKLKKDRHASATAIESAEAELAITTADLARERSELALARELHRRHRVQAPFGGMVTKKFIEAGQWVGRDDPVVEIVELDTIRVRATLPQRLFPSLSEGTSARVRFDALPDRQFNGRVFARIALGDESSRSFPLLIDIANPDHLLAPGMSARVWVELEADQVATLTVPRDAIVARSNGDRLLWRVSPDTDSLKVFPVHVETGRAQGDRIEVRGDGLDAGDRVVLLGNEQLRPGQAILDRTDAAPMAAQ